MLIFRDKYIINQSKDRSLIQRPLEEHAPISQVNIIKPTQVSLKPPHFTIHITLFKVKMSKKNCTL